MVVINDIFNSPDYLFCEEAFSQIDIEALSWSELSFKLQMQKYVDTTTFPPHNSSIYSNYSGKRLENEIKWLRPG